VRAGADDDVEEPEYNPWADVAVTSLHDDMAGRNVNQLWRAIEAGAVHKKRPLSRHEGPKEGYRGVRLVRADVCSKARFRSTPRLRVWG
jgi:hypothetical protein